MQSAVHKISALLSHLKIRCVENKRDHHAIDYVLGLIWFIEISIQTEVRKYGLHLIEYFLPCLCHEMHSISLNEAVRTETVLDICPVNIVPCRAVQCLFHGLDFTLFAQL